METEDEGEEDEEKEVEGEEDEEKEVEGEEDEQQDEGEGQEVKEKRQEVCSFLRLLHRLASSSHVTHLLCDVVFSFVAFSPRSCCGVLRSLLF